MFCVKEVFKMCVVLFVAVFSPEKRRQNHLRNLPSLRSRESNKNNNKCFKNYFSHFSLRVNVLRKYENNGQIFTLNVTCHFDINL